MVRQPWRPRSAGMRRQRGVAVITALLVVALAAGLAAFLLAQQSQALTRTARAAEQVQAALLARPVLDYARAVIFDSVKPGKRVDLTQNWARGLNAIPIDGAVASGALRDESGLFNLNNLAKDGAKSERDIALLARLLTNLKLDPGLANAAADWIDSDDEPNGPSGMENASYFGQARPVRAANRQLLQPAELARARGFDDAILLRLAPFVTALPTATSPTASARSKINLNTAPEEVLRALFPELGSEDMATLVRTRQTAPFDRIEGEGGARTLLKKVPAATWELVDVQSGWFRASIVIDNGGAQVRQLALLQRRADAADKWPSIIWVKTD